MKQKLLLIILVSFLVTSFSIAQDNNSLSLHSIKLKTQFFQIEEAANYGLVFNGLNLAAEYEWIKKDDNKMFSYSPQFGFGAAFNNGIGLSWSLKPIDVFYGFKIYKTENKNIYLGPYLETAYHLQLYPELQSGHHSWFSFIDFGPKLASEMILFNMPVKISISNSLAGFGSRPEVNPQSESYFYTLNFFDWLSDLNSNMEFGSLDLLNHTNIEVELTDFLKDGLSLTYEFEYYGYFDAPELHYLSHGINLKWCLGNSKEAK